MPLWIIISFFIISVLCLFSVFQLFDRREKEHGKSALLTYAFYAVIFLAIWVFGLSVPTYTLLLSMLTVFIACFIGHYLRFYTRSKTFDRYLHAFGALSFSLLIYCILENLINTEATKLFQAIFIFLIGNTLGVLFELIEAKHDTKAKTKSQKGLKDTNMDLLFNMIGSLVAGVVAYFWLL